MDKQRLKNYIGGVESNANTLDRQLIVKVAGVTFDDRQKFLVQIDRHTPIRLEQDRRNEYDTCAIKVLAKLKGVWECVGFIPKPMNKMLFKNLNAGVKLESKVHRVVGGMIDQQSGEKLSYGLHLVVAPEV